MVTVGQLGDLAGTRHRRGPRPPENHELTTPRAGLTLGRGLKSQVTTDRVALACSREMQALRPRATASVSIPIQR